MTAVEGARQSEGQLGLGGMIVDDFRAVMEVVDDLVNDQRLVVIPDSTGEIFDKLPQQQGLLCTKIRPNVTTGAGGIQFHRNHRDPVIHPMIWRRFFAQANSASGLHWADVAREAAATVGVRRPPR